jgi:hypothetical protein
MFHRAIRPTAFYRRHGAMAAGLLALWLQILAVAAPMPWMGTADAGAATASAQTAFTLCGADMGGGGPAPAGKSSLPCLQCPLCQTLHILASGSVPPVTILAAPNLPPLGQAWPVANAAQPALPAPAGFSSRAPPLV